MGETVDVLVVGKPVSFIFHSELNNHLSEGKYGTGSRGGGVSALICAVVDDRRSDAENGTWYDLS